MDSCARKLREQLQNVYGEDTLLGSDKLLTGLLVVTKRHDTASWWPIGDNSRNKYFGQPRTDGSHTLANSEYPLWQVVRASTAAPSYFDSELIGSMRLSRAIASTGPLAQAGFCWFP